LLCAKSTRSRAAPAGAQPRPTGTSQIPKKVRPHLPDCAEQPVARPQTGCPSWLAPGSSSSPRRTRLCPPGATSPSTSTPCSTPRRVPPAWPATWARSASTSSATSPGTRGRRSGLPMACSACRAAGSGASVGACRQALTRADPPCSCLQVMEFGYTKLHVDAFGRRILQRPVSFKRKTYRWASGGCSHDLRRQLMVAFYLWPAPLLCSCSPLA